MTLKEKIIARINKWILDKKEVEKMVNDYFELAAARGCETVKEYADAITWFAAV